MSDCGAVKHRVMQVGGGLALLDRPESVLCPECKKPLAPFSIHWPAGYDVRGKPILRECWPIYACDGCVAKQDAADMPTADRLAATGILGRNRFCTFESFVVSTQRLQHAKREAENWAKSAEGNLWLCGGPGTGKTHLAIAIAQVRIDAGCRVIFAEVPYLLDRLTEDYLADDSPQIRESRWATCDLLVLDDLGAEKPTEHKIERLTMLVNERGLQSRATVVTSNHRPEQMGERIPGRLLSRLQENGTKIETGTDDYRRRGKK